MTRAGLPKPEKFTAVADEYGVMALQCPACPQQIDEANLPDMALSTLLDAARRHIEDVHDRCDACGDYGTVGDLKPYVCRRKVHDDFPHEWVPA